MTETKKAEKTARKGMRLSVRNFGPIAEANVNLRPLFEKNRLIRYIKAMMSAFDLDLEKCIAMRDAIQNNENLSSK